MKQLNMYLSSRNPMSLFIILLMICQMAFGQQPSPTQTVLTLDSVLNMTSVIPSQFTYFSVNFQLTSADTKLLLVTVQTQQFDIIQIYTSMNYQGVDQYYQFPNDVNNSNFCSYSSIDSCAVGLPDLLNSNNSKNVTVYIGVQLLFTSQMSILATLEDIYPFKVGIKYDIDFTQWESAVFTIEASEVNLYEQLVIEMQYDSFQDAGKFALFAAVDQIPNNDTNRIQGKYMGAFTQILILEPLQNNNSTYYIILEGQLGTEFDVVIKPFEKSSPKLVMNDTVFYYSTGLGQKDSSQMNFSIAIDYSAEEEILPLLIDLNSLGGYGSFEVDYCDKLTNFTFENFNGQSGEIIIPVEQRKQCYAKVFDQGSLMIQNIIVSINTPWYFSFSIGVFEGEYTLMMRPYSQKMGTLIASEDLRVYEMEGYVNESFVLKFKTISGEEGLNFTLFQCKSRWLVEDKCKEILSSRDNGVVDALSPEYKQFNYTCAQKKHYRLQVSHTATKPLDSEYVLLLLPLNPSTTNLFPLRPIFSIISQNQYQYYVINLTLIQKQSNLTINNNTKVMITMVETNGNCLLLSSLDVEYPKYDQIFVINSTVDYSWNGKVSYTVNGDGVIYVGVMGAKESLYHLQVSVEVDEDTPESYVKLVSDKSLTYTLTAQKQDHILLSYKSHSIPYTIIISPQAPCLAYSYTLPFTNKSCRQLPSQITQRTIYLKIYRQSPLQQDNNDFKFMVYVYTGLHYLFEYSPVMIACQDTCWEFVTVYAREKIKIVHKGMGYIGRKDMEEDFSNQRMEIQCETSYPCSVTINASLPYGGQMELFYDSLDVQEIEWTTKPLTFQSLTDHKLFYMEIRSWNSLNTAIFYTQGLSLTIYYNIYSMRENATNAMQYGFPNSWMWMRKNVGNPLRRFHVVEFDKALIQSLGCKDENDVCIATLAVYPNTYAAYTPEIVNKSVGYFSCNTYEYYTPMNAPYQLSEEYSLVYFEHELTDDQKASISPFYYVKVQPVSSCRPQIFAPFTLQIDKNISYDKNMPYYGFYKIDSATLDKQNPAIDFIISTDTPCEYTLWLLDSDIQPVSENANYELQSDQNGMILVAFSDRFLWNDKKFTIMFDQPMIEIVIGKYEKSANGSITQPMINSSLGYITQSRRLQFTSAEAQSTLYIIKAVTSASNKVNMKISTYGGDTVIMTNERQKFVFSQNISTVTYRYYSNNDFLIFITTDLGSVNLKVTDFRRDNQRDVIDMVIGDSDSPWVKVNAVKGDIREYVITLENVLLANGKRNLQESDVKYPKVSFHIEETGTIGLPQLYDGVALFDAFYNEDAQNCYKYVTDQIVGRHTLNVDLIFGSEFINNVPAIHSRLSISNGESINSTWTKLPTGYRLSTQYYGDQTYEFCFSINEQDSLVSKQFYVIIEDIDCQLKHLTLDVPSAENIPRSYEIYQYVATENQTVMIEVVNCIGKPTLLGAKKYSDIYLGQVSQLGSFYRDQTKSIAKINLQLGYFFFAIKLDNLQDRYKIRVQLLQENEKLHYDKFELKQKTITKVRAVEDNGKEKIRVSLPSISTLNLSQQVKVHQIAYNLLVDNLKQYQPYTSNVIAKCPVLGNRSLSLYLFVQNISQNIKTNILSPQQQQITIDIPVQQVPQSFNLTGYVQIRISQPHAQTLTYYYDSTSFKLKNARNTGMSGVGVVFVIMIVIGGLIVVYIVFKRWKKHRRDSRVAFQMSNFNHQQNHTVGHKETEVTVTATPTPVKPLKKALNQDVGYGQFIDESM